MSPRTRVLAAGVLAVSPVAVPFAVGALASQGGTDVPATVAFTFQDPRIVESSGLVVRDGRAYTVNDSGDGPFVYQVDPRTGRTVAVTTYDDEDPEDVEALAAGPGGALWVGDIGDNRRWRSSVRVHRLVPGRESSTVSATSYDLAYPGGSPHDAETLLVQPRTGRLLVVTKGYGGGVVYRAPRRLRAGETHVLETLGRVEGMVTDGTFLPGGDRVLLRTYGSAELYSYPGLRLLARSELPRQELGEGIAVDGGSVYLSSEGERSDVLTFPLRRVERARLPVAEQDRPTPPPPGTSTATGRDPRPWMGLGPTGFLVAAVGAGLGVGLGVAALRAVLRRGRRRR